MKNSTMLLTGLLLALPATAQTDRSDNEPLDVVKTADVIFPASVLQLGIKEGEARVILQVDEKGVLADYLVTSYSHPAFADRAVAAIKKWQFHPARVNGQPCTAISGISFLFRAEGVVVVDMTASSYVSMLNYRLNPGASSFRARTLSELDRIPAPVKIVKPHYTPEIAAKTEPTTVAVDFYIDEAGHVRLPAVSRETNQNNDVLASAAIAAVSQWEFEAPKSHGRNVLVLARQEFHFRPVGK